MTVSWGVGFLGVSGPKTPMDDGVKTAVLPLLRIVAQCTRQIFLCGRPCAHNDVGCRFHGVGADVVPPRRLGIGQKLGESVFAHDGLVPGFEFLLGLRLPCSRLKLIEHGTLDGAVHPAVVDRGCDVFGEVAAVPTLQHRCIDVRLRGVVCEHPGVGFVDWGMVVELDGLGFGEGPIVFGRRQGLMMAPARVLPA